MDIDILRSSFLYEIQKPY